MLIAQTCLLAFATWLTCRAVSRWKGIWAGVCFCLFCLNVATPFIASASTEPLGLTLAVLAIPFAVNGIRTRSLPLLLLSVAVLWIALLTRMGALFLPVFLGIWILLFARKSGRRSVIFCGVALCAILTTGLLYSSAVKKLYGDPVQTTGANFAMTAYGLSVNKDWSAAYRDFEKNLPHMRNEGEFAKFLLIKTKESFVNNPLLLLKAVSSNIKQTVKNLFTMSVRNILIWPRPLNLFEYLLLAAMAAGAILAFRAGNLRPKLLFFLLVSGAFIASGAIVFRDAGARVLSIGYPFLWLAYCSFLATPGTPGKAFSRTVTRELPATALMTLLVLAAGLVVPAIRSGIPLPATAGGNLCIQGGTTKTAGVLIVDDDAPLPRDIPSARFNAFHKAFALHLGDRIQPSYWPAPPFVYAAAAYTSGASMGVGLFFMPPKILRSPETQAWRVKVQPWPAATNEINNQLGTQLQITAFEPVLQ
jgi:hypothetical protein